MDEKVRIRRQLKAACQLTNARWAAWIARNETEWKLRNHFGLSRSRIEALQNLVNESRVATRLAGGLTTGRTRSLKTDPQAARFGCENLYFFPSQEAQMVLVVGASGLIAKDKGFFQILAQAGIPQSQTDVSVDNVLAGILMDLEGSVVYDLFSALDRVLQILIRYIVCDTVVVGLRYGDYIRLEAVWPREEELIGQQILIDTPGLESIVSNRSLEMENDIANGQPCPLFPGFRADRGSWLGVPLWVGKRVIGIICFYSKKKELFNQEIAQRASVVAAHVAPAIETTMALAEASRHLEKLALLNELASAASVDISADEAASRIINRLKRIFNTELVSILMLSSNGKTLHEFGLNPLGTPPLVLPVESSLSGYVVETGMPYRTGDVSQAPRYFHLTDGVHSELAVPLKYRGKVIGILDLESREPNAFSLRDEQLLVVMASQLAGLIENIRLNDETRERARNLDLIHQVVQEVVGLTDIPQIAQVAAELMAERFAFELALVNLIDERGEYLVVEGIGGNVSPKIVRGMKRPVEVGISGQVCKDGISRLVNDTHHYDAYDPLPDWSGGSEMCVPLQDGDLVFGVVVVEKSQIDAFSENDLLALEALAGVLSSVMINARSYQQLRVNLRHLQAVRDTALDISADLDLDTLLERVTTRARELVGARGAELGLVNEEKQTVQIKVSKNPWESYSKGLKIPFNQGIAGKMAVSGQTIAVNDYSAWSGRLRLGNPPPFTAVAGVPLKYKGRVIGTLTISHDEPDRGFDPEDIRLLELLAPQVAVSVRNARLYQELQTLMEAERLAKDHLIRSARLAAVGELAAGVAHELNNPLTTVAGFVELVLDDLPADSPHRPDLELVLKEARRAREVVRRLLDFSRPGEGFRVRADVNDLIGDVVALIHHLVHTSGIELKVHMHEELPWIHVDRDQIKQVLLNLVHNAIHAMPQGGTLTLQSLPKEKNGVAGVAIQVRDTGQGIKPEHMDRLFEPFFTTRPPGKGTGLGLSVSYGIITDHGGFIDVESQPGKGSNFTIWLPIESNRVLL